MGRPVFHANLEPATCARYTSVRDARGLPDTPIWNAAAAAIAARMKRAVSVSLGPSARDMEVEIDLLGERVHLQRIGTDGDMTRAARLFEELDGSVDALGVGGAMLRIEVAGQWFPLHSYLPVVRRVKRSPLVDGSIVKRTLERRVAAWIDRHFPVPIEPRRVLVMVAVDRWGMAESFVEAGYDYTFGDLMFGLDIPVPVRSERLVRYVAPMILPIVTRLPLAWLSPTARPRPVLRPGIARWFEWATVVAGDTHYIRRNMPTRLDGKIVCTNSTTPEDVAYFRAAGVRHLVTTTPMIGGRSFGTNLIEAALVAASGCGRTLDNDEVDALLDAAAIEPTLRTLGTD